MISHFDDDAIAAFWRQKNAAKWLSAGALIPDELVYTNGPPMWVENWDYKKTTRQLTSKIKKEKKPPNAFLVKGVGLFVAGTGQNTDTIRDTVKNSLVVRVNASRLGGIVSLNRQEQDFINKWEAEAFRKNMAAGSVQGELQGQIAVVTGAGSGLGRSIAIGLAKAGAMVALFDIDKKEAAQTQSNHNRRVPKFANDGSAAVTLLMRQASIRRLRPCLKNGVVLIFWSMRPGWRRHTD